MPPKACRPSDDPTCCTRMLVSGSRLVLCQLLAVPKSLNCLCICSQRRERLALRGLPSWYAGIHRWCPF